MIRTNHRNIIRKLLKINSKEYNMHKASEECQELGLVLNQKLLKPTKVDDQEIIDEIGDVIIRLEILKKMYSKALIQKRIDKKMNNYQKWLDNNTYTQI